MTAIRTCVPAVVFGILMATGAHADALGDLRGQLERFTGAASIRATVQVELTVTDDPHPDGVTGTATVDVEDDAEGFRLIYPDALAAQAAGEEVRRVVDTDLEAPTVEALDAIGGVRLMEALNAGPRLGAMLGRATLKDVRQTDDGATVLILAGDPATYAVDERYFKGGTLDIEVVVGADGIPRSMDLRHQIKAGWFVLSFLTTVEQAWRFAAVGDRLVVTRHDEDMRARAFGREILHRNQIVSVVPAS